LRRCQSPSSQPSPNTTSRRPRGRKCAIAPPVGLTGPSPATFDVGRLANTGGARWLASIRPFARVWPFPLSPLAGRSSLGACCQLEETLPQSEARFKELRERVALSFLQTLAAPRCRSASSICGHDATADGQATPARWHRRLVGDREELRTTRTSAGSFLVVNMLGSCRRTDNPRSQRWPNWPGCRSPPRPRRSTEGTGSPRSPGNECFEQPGSSPTPPTSWPGAWRAVVAAPSESCSGTP